MFSDSQDEQGYNEPAVNGLTHHGINVIVLGDSDAQAQNLAITKQQSLGNKAPVNKKPTNEPLPDEISTVKVIPSIPVFIWEQG